MELGWCLPSCLLNCSVFVGANLQHTQHDLEHLATNVHYHVTRLSRYATFSVYTISLVCLGFEEDGVRGGCGRRCVPSHGSWSYLILLELPNFCTTCTVPSIDVKSNDHIFGRLEWLGGGGNLPHTLPHEIDNNIPLSVCLDLARALLVSMLHTYVLRIVCK